MLGQHSFHHSVNVGEPYLSREESAHRYFVGGAKNRRVGSTLLSCIQSQSKARVARLVQRAKVQ